MKVGILTGGGDCPGLNAVIKGAVLGLLAAGHEPMGIRHGWKGLLEGEWSALALREVEGIERTGGTILHTSRTNPCKNRETQAQAVRCFHDSELDAIIAVGGDDTLGACNRLNKAGVPAVGVPKTIDNDLSGTDVTFGFDTATNIVMEALDRLHTTAASHERILVAEIMGRHAGWITLHGGLAGGAHAVLLPEQTVDLDALAAQCRARRDAGHSHTLIAASEGIIFTEASQFITQDTKRDEFGNVHLGGVGRFLAKELEARTGQDSRHVVLGHLQRGGQPTAFDRVLGLRLGLAAARAVAGGDYGTMVGLEGTAIRRRPLEDGVKELKVVPQERVEEKDALLGSPQHPTLSV